MTLKNTILEAAELGLVTLEHVDGGEAVGLYDDVADWIACEPTRWAMEAALEAAGIDAGAGDVHEIMHQMARQRAQFASIKGA